ncbi:hypothetical protein GCM10027047_33550 [Rhodococcus aerolatus]
MTAGADDRARLRLLTSVVAQSSVGMAVHPVDGSAATVNPALVTMLRRSEAELASSWLVDFAADDVAPVDRLAAGTPTGPEPVVTELRYRRGDGTTMWGRRTAVLLVTTPGEPGHVLVQLEDVSARHESDTLLRRAALTDPLTGLLHRGGLTAVLDAAVRRAGLEGGVVAVLFVDLDGFKAVNDARGHTTGDAVLREVAARLRSVVRSGDTALRVGGDEFVVVCRPLLGAAARTTDLARRVGVAIGSPMWLPGGVLRVTASVGVAVTDEVPPDDLVHRADADMYARRAARRAAAPAA